MTTQPSGTPPSERPTGPPSGPLSGDRQGAPPPSPPGGTGGGGRGPGPGRGSGSGSGSGSGPGSGPHGEPAGKPWWRSGPRLAAALVAVAAAVAVAVVLTRPSGTPGTGGELFLQPAGSAGKDPFTESTATTQGVQEPRPTPTSSEPVTGTINTRSVSGSQPGLYGGTQDLASCDVEKQIKELAAVPAKNSAFASALGIQPADVPQYLRSLTPVQLRMDTRVTNHGYKDGVATPYQAVLEAGTAVLVDSRGVPRVRCACGNPLGPPVPLKPYSRRYGQPWAAYRPQGVVVIAPSETVVDRIVIYDHANHSWYERGRGPTPGRDKPVPPPVLPSPPVTASPPTTSPGVPATPTAATGKPTEATGTPTEATGTPTEHTATPTRTTGAPTETTGAPTEATGTPAETTGAPAEDIIPPTDEPEIPTVLPPPALTDRTATPTGTATTSSGPPAPPSPSSTEPASPSP